MTTVDGKEPLDATRGVLPLVKLVHRQRGENNENTVKNHPAGRSDGDSAATANERWRMISVGNLGTVVTRNLVAG